VDHVVGVMGTEATVRSGSYPQMIHAHDARAQITSVACPGLAPVIQNGDSVDEGVVEMVDRYTAPLKDAQVDTVILGCTHFPMISRLLRRSLPGMTLIDGRREIAREVAETLDRKGVLRPPGPEGSRRFACSVTRKHFGASPAAFSRCPSAPWRSWTRRRPPAG